MVSFMGSPYLSHHTHKSTSYVIILVPMESPSHMRLPLVNNSNWPLQSLYLLSGLWSGLIAALVRVRVRVGLGLALGLRLGTGSEGTMN